MNRIDLNGDGTDEAVAYLLDPKYCGERRLLALRSHADRGTNELGSDRRHRRRLRNCRSIELAKGADGWTIARQFAGRRRRCRAGG